MDALRLTLRQLQIFVAVARRGSTMAASADIALSQSATSAAVSQLERLLDLQLFDRAGKRLLLNEDGRALLPQAMSLLEHAAGIEQIARTEGMTHQALRIGASTTIGNYVLPALLARYVEAADASAPRQWRSRVQIANTDVICAGLGAFELDIGLIEGANDDPALIATPWIDDELLLVCAPSTCERLTGASPATIAQLKDLLWLVREPGSGTRQATDRLLLPLIGSYRNFIELASSEAIKHTAAAGLGVACLSRWVVADLLATGRLTELPSALPALRRPFFSVVHRKKHPTRALAQFIDLVGATAREHPPTRQR